MPWLRCGGEKMRTAPCTQAGLCRAMQSNRHAMQATHIILNLLVAILPRKIKQGKLVLITHFIESSVSKILSCQREIYVKIINEILLIILFHKKCSLAGASFIFTTSLQPQVPCSAATCSWWLPYWTEMLLNLSGNAFTHALVLCWAALCDVG